jgi:hypothetical protein
MQPWFTPSGVSDAGGFPLSTPRTATSMPRAHPADWTALSAPLAAAPQVAIAEIVREAEAQVHRAHMLATQASLDAAEAMREARAASQAQARAEDEVQYLQAALHDAKERIRQLEAALQSTADENKALREAAAPAPPAPAVSQLPTRPMLPASHWATTRTPWTEVREERELERRRGGASGVVGVVNGVDGVKGAGDAGVVAGAAVVASPRKGDGRQPHTLGAAAAMIGTMMTAPGAAVAGDSLPPRRHKSAADSPPPHGAPPSLSSYAWRAKSLTKRRPSPSHHSTRPIIPHSPPTSTPLQHSAAPGRPSDDFQNHSSLDDSAPQ